MIEALNDTRQHNIVKNIKNIFLGNLNKKTASIFIINILVIAILLLISAIQFETIDDYMIYELLSGKWGQSTSFVVYINIFLANALVWLFRFIPNVNWYVLMLLITHVISFTVLGRLINKKFKNGMAIYAGILVTMYIPLLIFLQYTSQTAMLILVGCLYAMNTITNKEKKYKLIFASALILFGSLIRFGALMYVLPYAFLAFIIILIKKKLNAKEIIAMLCFYLIVGISCIMLKYIHVSIYNSNAVYKEYMEYNNIRTVIHDYLGYNYNENVQVYNSVGWSANDYVTIMLFNNADELVFNKSNMEHIIENVKLVLPEFTSYIVNIFNELIFPYLLLLIILIYMSIREGKKENILIATLAIILEIIFITMGKVNIRTCVLNYIIAIVFITFSLETLLDKDKTKTNYIFGLNALLCIVAIGLILVGNVATVITNKENSMETSYNNFLEYISKNEQNAYVYSRVWTK